MHAELTLEWLLKLKSDTNKVLQVSALAHDIDRAISGITEKDLKDYSKIAEFKQGHANESANFTAELLKKHNYDQPTIEDDNNIKAIIKMLK